MKRIKPARMAIISALMMLIASLFSFGYSAWSTPLPESLKSGAFSPTKSTPVAFYGSSYFSTVEAAVSSANKAGNKTVYIIPGTNPTITSPIIINSNTTLILPYSTGDYTGTRLYKSIDSLSNGGGTDAYDSANGDSCASPNVYNKYTGKCTLTVTLNSGVTITNNGKLYIGGIQSGGNGGTMAGHISSSYAKIVLGAGAKIYNYGTFVNYGYVVGTDTKTTSVPSLINYAGSSTYVPFVLIEHRGGTTFSGLSSLSGSPFNRFYFPSVVDALVRFEGSAMLYSVPDLYAGSQHNRSLVSIIGSNGLIAPQDNFILTSLFTFESDGVSSLSGTMPKDYINFYGSFNINSLSISIEVEFLGFVTVYDLTTADVYFPISCYYDISLNEAENASTSLISSTSQKVKVLPGASLKINENVSFSCPGLVCYEKYSSDKYSAGTGEDSDLKGNNGVVAYEQMDKDGTLIVNGTLISTYLGGFIQTSSDDAKISFKNNSVTTYEVKSGSNDYYSFVVSANANVDSASNLVSPLPVGKYKSTSTYWSLSQTYTITFNYPSNGTDGDVLSYSVNVGGVAYNNLTSTLIIDELSSGTQYSITSITNGYLTNLNLNTNYTISGDVSISINKKVPITSFKVVVGTPSNANAVNITLTFMDGNSTVKTVSNITSTKYLSSSDISGVKTGMTMKFSSENIDSATFQGAAASKNTKYLISNPDCELSVTPTTSGCLVSGTLITLANGDKKEVQDLKVGDMVKVFNHESGEYINMPVIFNNHDNQKMEEYEILNLIFENKNIEIVGNHGFFDSTLKKYVFIDKTNYIDFLGHQFIVSNDGVSNSFVTLTSAYLYTKFTSIFSPISYFYMNLLANDLLTVGPPVTEDGRTIEGFVNYFEFNSDGSWNLEQMQKDLEMYGVYMPEDFADYISSEAFYSSPGVYLKVAVGKGILSYQDIVDVIIYLLHNNLIDQGRKGDSC